MHELVAAVIDQHDLSKAGELFGVSDWDILSDLHAALCKLKAIFNTSDYASNENSQSVVEICLARITSAIRETGTIETYAPGLVDALEDCLQHSFKPPTSQLVDNDAPHAKIASDILSCIFLHYSKKCVMAVAIPVTVKVLQKGSRDLTRSVSSYLSLAAIHNARLLAQYAQSLISSIIAGNYALLRVLSQIYPENKEPFHASCSALVNCLPECEQSEKLSLLQLCSLIAQSKPEIMVAHIVKFRSCLQTLNTCAAVLPLLLTLITSGYSGALSGEVAALKKAADSFGPQTMATIVKILTAIAKANKSVSQDVISYLVLQCTKADSLTMPILLREVEAIAGSYPETVANFVPEIQRLTENGSHSLRALVARIKDICDGKSSLSTVSSRGASNEKITVVSVSSGNHYSHVPLSSCQNSREYLLDSAGMRPSASGFSSTPGTPRNTGGVLTNGRSYNAAVNGNTGAMPLAQTNVASSLGSRGHRSSPFTAANGSTLSYADERQERLREIKETLLEHRASPVAFSSAGATMIQHENPLASVCAGKQQYFLRNSSGHAVITNAARKARVLSVASPSHGLAINPGDRIVVSPETPNSGIASYSQSQRSYSLSRMKSKSSGNLSLSKRYHHHNYQQVYQQHQQQFLAAQQQKSNGSLAQPQNGSSHHASSSGRSGVGLNVSSNDGSPQQPIVVVASSKNSVGELVAVRKSSGDGVAPLSLPFGSSGGQQLLAEQREIYVSPYRSTDQHLLWVNSNQCYVSNRDGFATSASTSNYTNPYKSRNEAFVATANKPSGGTSHTLSLPPPAPSLQPFCVAATPMRQETTFNKDQTITTRTGSGNTMTTVMQPQGPAALQLGPDLSMDPRGGNNVMVSAAVQSSFQPLPKNSNASIPGVSGAHSPPSAGESRPHHRTVIAVKPTNFNGGSLQQNGTSRSGNYAHSNELFGLSPRSHRGSVDLLRNSAGSVPPNGNGRMQVCLGTDPSSSSLQTPLSSSVDQMVFYGATGRMIKLLRAPIKGDAVKQFCEKHLDKIRTYVGEINARYPVPCQCTVEESKHKQRMRIHFACQESGEYCLHKTNYFAIKTKNPQIWLHLMFLHLQAQSNHALSQAEVAVSRLKICWECLPQTVTKNRSFSALVTASFPQFKEQQVMAAELQASRYYDLFAYSLSSKKWACFACNHPERVANFLTQRNAPVIEGQLKEKKGRWKFFKRWRTRYFTLSGATLSYKGSFNENIHLPAIDIRSIRSVKSVSSARKGRRAAIPKAFEIFTDADCSYVLKAKDHKNAEEWFQCLQIAVAQANKNLPDSKCDDSCSELQVQL